MNRRRFLIIVIMILIISVIGCGNKSDTSANSAEVVQEDNVRKEPDLLQIRSICKLATLECYYHNVAKANKGAGTGISHLGESDRKFWVEYDGTDKIGVDMSRGSMDVDGTNITIYMPEAEILSIKLDSESLSNTVSDADSWNSNPIKGKDVTQAVYDAQESIKDEIGKDSTLFASAQDRAKKLIENYINKLGELTDTKFTITWKTVHNTINNQ